MLILPNCGPARLIVDIYDADICYFLVVIGSSFYHIGRGGGLCDDDDDDVVGWLLIFLAWSGAFYLSKCLFDPDEVNIVVGF